VLQHQLAAEEGRQRQQRVADVRRRGEVGDQPLEGRPVLASQRRAQLAPGRRVGLRLVEKPADEIGMAEVDLEPLAIAMISASASGWSSPTSSTPAW